MHASRHGAPVSGTSPGLSHPRPRAIRKRSLLPGAVAVAGLIHGIAAVASIRADDLVVSPAAFDAAFAAIAESAGRTNESARLHSLFDLQWRYSMTENPETATYNGFPGQNHRWTDLSEDAVERRRAESRRPWRVLETIRREALPPDDQLSYDLFRRTVEQELAGLRFPTEWLPLTQLNGVQQDLPQTLAMMPRGTARDFENLVARLRSSPVLIRQTVALLRKGIARGLVMPRIPLRDVPQQVLNLVPEDPRRSALFQPFAESPTFMARADHLALQGVALGILTNDVYPACRELHQCLVNEYLPACRDTIACSALPDGTAWYTHNVRVRTTTDLTPAQIHEIGLREVRRLRGEMDRVIDQAGFKGSFQEFLTFLRTDPSFFYSRGTELLAGYRDITKRADLELPKLFGRLPRTPYGVLPVPTYAEKSQTGAYYQPGSMTAGRPGIYFANTYALQSRPKWEMEALSLHEAVPGHHLQIALAQELDRVPEFRRHAETTAFVEGWALYSESLGPAMGFYQDPYSRFGQLTYEMWRAIRLVVDTGMHSLGWSRQKAIEFFMENAGKAEHEILVEVDRYIVWPGQALAYKIGELKIKELRATAERELGPRFEIRRFHDELLGQGALPLDVLEPRMLRWIESERARPAATP